MLTYARIKPVVNEVELHPLNTQLKLVKYMKSQDIVPIGYCPLARGADTKRCPNIFEHEIIKKYMDKYSKSGAQILLNWGLQRGHIVIPTSNNFGRQQENFGCLDFKLEAEEVDEISTINENVRICDDDPWLSGHTIFA